MWNLINAHHQWELQKERKAMNETLHDAFERIINICRQQMGLKDGDTPAEAVEALSGIVDKASRAQRVIRVADAVKGSNNGP